MMRIKPVWRVTVPLLLLCPVAQAQRTSWGDPDLQGTWSNATLTPRTG